MHLEIHSGLNLNYRPLFLKMRMRSIFSMAREIICGKNIFKKHAVSILIDKSRNDLAKITSERGHAVSIFSKGVLSTPDLYQPQNLPL